jgi:hypothetical protein
MAHYVAGRDEVFEYSPYDQSVQAGFLLGSAAVYIWSVLEEFTNCLSGFLKATIFTNTLKLIRGNPPYMHVA